MPVEIKEIVIRATIGEGGAGAPAPGSSPVPAGGAAADPNAMQECIEQVFRILDDKKER